MPLSSSVPPHGPWGAGPTLQGFSPCRQKIGVCVYRKKASAVVPGTTHAHCIPMRFQLPLPNGSSLRCCWVLWSRLLPKFFPLRTLFCKYFQGADKLRGPQGNEGVKIKGWRSVVSLHSSPFRAAVRGLGTTSFSSSPQGSCCLTGDPIKGHHIPFTH